MWATMKYVALTWMSNGIMASMIPLIPPHVNVVRKPSANSIGVSRCRTPFHSVASQEKILMPVGTAMITVVMAIGMRIHAAMPEVNMWWAHTVKPSTTMASNEKAIIRYPKIGLRDFTAMISLTIPNPGSIMM